MSSESNGATSSRNQFGRAQASSSRNAMMSPRDDSIPVLRAPDSPRA